MPYDRRRHGPRRVVGPGFHERVFVLVERVPAGFVTTYGDLATALGLPSAARHVGYALAALPEHRTFVPWHRAGVPWHRVVNSRGLLSAGERQRVLLESEGVRVREGSKIVDFRQVRLPLDLLLAALPRFDESEES